MRLFRLELKRILKSRRTLILLAIALLLSVAMAYLPISFEVLTVQRRWHGYRIRWLGSYQVQTRFI